MEWIYLVAAGTLYCFGCLLSYANQYKEKWWYLPTGIVLGGIINALWFLSAKIITDKDRLLVYNLTWDSMLMLVYYIMPLLLFDAKLDKWGWIALSLIIIGILILKTR